MDNAKKKKKSKVNKCALLDHSFNWCKIDLLILVSCCYITSYYHTDSEEKNL